MGKSFLAHCAPGVDFSTGTKSGVGKLAKSKKAKDSADTSSPQAKKALPRSTGRLPSSKDHMSDVRMQQAYRAGPTGSVNTDPLEGNKPKQWNHD